MRMPRVRMMFPHFSVSSTRLVVNSAGLLPTGT
jgi:hypothetical protein